MLVAQLFLLINVKICYLMQTQKGSAIVIEGRLPGVL